MKVKARVLSGICCLPFMFGVTLQAQISFFQPLTYSGSGNLFAADFNGDGKVDLLTSDGTLNLGQGDGTFSAGTPVTTPSPIVAVADFNGDGRPDVLEQGTATLMLLLGNGNGTFQAPISTPSDAGLGSISAFDFNGDGKADVVGLSNGAVLVYFSKGDGTFASAITSNAGVSGLLSIGDFNGDGKMDVVVSTDGDSPTWGLESVLLGNGDGTFQVAKTSVGGGRILSASVQDFNRDGKLDVVLSGCDLIYGCLEWLLLGNGDGTLQAPIFVSGGTPPLEGFGPLAVGDFDGDGSGDIAVQGNPARSAVQIYMGNGDGTFSNTFDYVLNYFAQWNSASIIVADFNGDNKQDIATGNTVLLGKGDGTFQGIQGRDIYDFGYSEVFGDFDNDGTPDLAAVWSGNVSIFNNDGTGKLPLIHTYPIQQLIGRIVTNDFNGDGNLDLVVFGTDVTSNQWNYSLLLGNGDGTFQPPIFTQQMLPGAALDYFAFVVGDFNNDGKQDIVVGLLSFSPDQTFEVLLGHGDGTFAAPSPFTLTTRAPGGYVVTGDFNGDGKLDLAVGTSISSPSSADTVILYGNGDGSFQDMVLPATLAGFETQWTADLNNDGKPDLIGTSSKIALGKGDGTFTVLSGPFRGVSAIGDVNGDGTLDILNIFAPANNPNQLEIAVASGNGDGTFGSIANLPVNFFLPSDIEIKDMNGDGRPDIVFGITAPQPAYEVGAIAVLLNTSPPDFAVRSAPGSPPSQTVSAGQSAKFNLLVTPFAAFSGTVTLSCSISPTVSPALACSLSSSSLQVGGKGAQPVAVNVGTTTAMNSAVMSLPHSQLMPLPMTVLSLLLGFVWLRSGKRRALLIAPVLMLVFLPCTGCGGSPSPPIHGTPPGTYTVTVAAGSGSLNHSLQLTVTVQ